MVLITHTASVQCRLQCMRTAQCHVTQRANFRFFIFLQFNPLSFRKDSTPSGPTSTNGLHTRKYLLQIWVREHNRLCGVLEGNQGTNDLSGDEQFEISKAAVIAKMQVRFAKSFSSPQCELCDRHSVKQSDVPHVFSIFCEGVQTSQYLGETATALGSFELRAGAISTLCAVVVKMRSWSSPMLCPLL